MGKYLDKFRGGIKKVDENLKNLDGRGRNEENFNDNFNDNDNFSDGRMNDDFFNEGRMNDSSFDDVGIQKSQKPESFHHFILENKYQDLERSIRGFKDVMDKETQKWRVVRKETHCFTDEESEGIVRLAQGLLSTDIKLATMSLEAFGKMMDLILEQLENYFYRIAEYRYGRYKDYEVQGKMKDENKKILMELYNRIWANYSRSIAGTENRLTHESVKGQESLQNTERDILGRNRMGGVRL